MIEGTANLQHNLLDFLLKQKRVAYQNLRRSSLLLSQLHKLLKEALRVHQLSAPVCDAQRSILRSSLGEVLRTKGTDEHTIPDLRKRANIDAVMDTCRESGFFDPPLSVHCLHHQLMCNENFNVSNPIHRWAYAGPFRTESPTRPQRSESNVSGIPSTCIPMGMARAGEILCTNDVQFPPVSFHGFLGCRNGALMTFSKILGVEYIPNRLSHIGAPQSVSRKDVIAR